MGFVSFPIISWERSDTLKKTPLKQHGSGNSRIVISPFQNFHMLPWSPSRTLTIYLYMGRRGGGFQENPRTPFIFYAPGCINLRQTNLGQPLFWASAPWRHYHTPCRDHQMTDLEEKSGRHHYGYHAIKLSHIGRHHLIKLNTRFKKHAVLFIYSSNFHWCLDLFLPVTIN